MAKSNGQLLFEALPSRNINGEENVARWDIQPDHLKQKFEEIFATGYFYHSGYRRVYALRKDGSLYSYSPILGDDAMKHRYPNTVFERLMYVNG